MEINMANIGKDLISVIVPVYNSASGVFRCLESVCAQTYSNLEIIVVYKKSTDDSLKQIKSIQDSRIKIIEQIENTGPGGARNIGVDNANGQWIGFVEADDYIAPDFYEKLLNTAISNRCDIAQGQIVQGDWFSTQQSGVCQSYRDKLLRLKNGASFDKLFRAEFIRKHNIRFMEFVRWEDNPFVFKALYYGDIATDCSAKYFYVPSPWTDEYKVKLKNDILPVCHEIWSFLKSVRLTKTEEKLAKKAIIRCVAGSFIDDNEVYSGLMKLFNNPLFLWIMYHKRILKQKKDEK